MVEKWSLEAAVSMITRIDPARPAAKCLSRTGARRGEWQSVGKSYAIVRQRVTESISRLSSPAKTIPTIKAACPAVTGM